MKLKYYTNILKNKNELITKAIECVFKSEDVNDLSYVTLYFGNLEEILIEFLDEKELETRKKINDDKIGTTYGKTLAKQINNKFKVSIIISDKLNNNEYYLICTIIHELCHAIDYNNYYKFYGQHDSNDKNELITEKAFSHWIEYRAVRKVNELLLEFSKEDDIMLTYSKNIIDYIKEIENISYSNMTFKQHILLYKFKDILLSFLGEISAVKKEEKFINELVEKNVISKEVGNLFTNLSGLLNVLYNKEKPEDVYSNLKIITRYLNVIASKLIKR